MPKLKISSFEIELSAYGYGMMALSTVIAILLFNGYFQRIGPDSIAVWFAVACAAISGALAVLHVKISLPHAKKPTAIAFITLMFFIMFGGYLTSFFGYSETYILYFLHPFPYKDFSFSEFVQNLGQVWLAVTVTAILCTIAYLVVQFLTHSAKSAVGTTGNIPAEESKGLAE